RREVLIEDVGMASILGEVDVEHRHTDGHTRSGQGRQIGFNHRNFSSFQEVRLYPDPVDQPACLQDLNDLQVVLGEALQNQDLIIIEQQLRARKVLAS